MFVICVCVRVRDMCVRVFVRTGVCVCMCARGRVWKELGGGRGGRRGTFLQRCDLFLVSKLLIPRNEVTMTRTPTKCSATPVGQFARLASGQVLPSVKKRQINLLAHCFYDNDTHDGCQAGCQAHLSPIP